MAANSDDRGKSARDREAESFLRAEKRVASSLLAVMPTSLVGRQVCVTLLDDTRVTGRLVLVDGFLNLHLDNGVAVVPPANRRRAPPSAHLQEMAISGKRVRYISLPDDLDVKASIETYLNSVESQRPPCSGRPHKADKYAYLRKTSAEVESSHPAP